MLQVIFVALMFGGVIKSLGEHVAGAVQGFQTANKILDEADFWL